MKRIISGLALLLAASTIYLLSTSEAQAPTPIPAMWLQAATPGITQTGNGHISGSFIAGNLSGNGASLSGLGGDLSGSLGAGLVVGLQTRPISAAAPSSGQILRWSGASWGPSSETAYVAGLGLSLGGTTFSFDTVYGDGRYVNEGQAAGGVLAGTYPNPSFSLTGAANNEALTYSSGSVSWTFPYASGLVLPITATNAVGVAFDITTTATSDCGVFSVTNASSAAEAVQAESDGTGDTIFGYMTGTGRAGLFQITNTANTNDALRASSNGSGNAIYGYMTGSGTAGSFLNLDTSNTSRVLEAITDGTGSAGYFQQTSSSASSATVDVTKAGGGYGVNVANTQVGGSGGCIRLINDSDGTYTLFAASHAAVGLRYTLYAVGDAPSARTIFGYASETTAGTTPYGVYGQCSGSTNGYGVYAAGDSGASGLKSFRIDHPFDPTNKYLLHYSNESPEPQDVYCGTITTGANGYAWVSLPNYFEEINKDFKYQLTVIDGSDDFILVKVTKEISNNTFQIRTSKPGVKVSWEVKGTRNDAYCRMKHPKDELPKVGPEKGTYQHPELYGAPEQMGINWQPYADGRVKKK